MDTSSKNVMTVYKSRNNIIDLLQKRGFDVSEYNEFSINDVSMMINNKQLDLLFSDNNDNKIFVKYYLGKSLRPNNITEFVEDLFNLEEILNKNDELLIISKDDINDSIKSTLIQLWETNQIYVNIININRLQFNILNHVFVPEHYVLSNEEKNVVYKKSNITEDSKMPEISRFDPVSCVIGLRPNQLCKIIRPSKTAITSDFYRLCYNK